MVLYHALRSLLLVVVQAKTLQMAKKIRVVIGIEICLVFVWEVEVEPFHC